MKAAVLKTARRESRGFESLLLRAPASAHAEREFDKLILPSCVGPPPGLMRNIRRWPGGARLPANAVERLSFGDMAEWLKARDC